MIDFTYDIVKGLQENPIVAGYVAEVNGMPNISQLRVISAVYPAIAVREIESFDELFCDDECVTQFCQYEIEIWSSDGSHVMIQAEIDKFMRSLGFTRFKIRTFDDPSIKQYRKILGYQQSIELPEPIEKGDFTIYGF